MPAQLVALTEGPNILLDKPILLFGRNPECDIQIDSRKISRRHCCLAQVNDYLVVRDLGSTNGIRINGVRVVEGRLKPGDELTIGNHRYQIRWDALDHRGPRPPASQVEVEPVHAPAGRQDEDDELLESCDDPVPLVEPEGTPRSGPFSPLHHLANAPLGNTAFVSDKPPPQPEPAPKEPLLPDELNLAPVSDELPRNRAKAGPAS